MTLAEVNALDQDRFTELLGWIFEHSPWVMRCAWLSRPFASIDALHAAAVTCVERASLHDQLALLRAHPDLGTRAHISDASQDEQASAGLNRLNADEFAKLHALNKAYTAQFGFPFLYAVKGSSKHDILAALERRLQNSAEKEFAEALQQVHRIARFRLEDAIS